MNKQSPAEGTIYDEITHQWVRSELDAAAEKSATPDAAALNSAPNLEQALEQTLEQTPKE